MFPRFFPRKGQNMQEYPLTIQLINGLAVSDDDEMRYESLIRILNEYICNDKTMLLNKREKEGEEKEKNGVKP